MTNKFFLIIAGILGYVGYQKYLLSQRVKINFKDLSINWNNILNPSANIVLTIDNPTNTTADLQNVSGKIFLQDLQIGKVENLILVKKILPNQSTNIDFNINFDSIGVGLGILSTNLKNTVIRFEGSIKVDFFNIPLNFTHKIL